MKTRSGLWIGLAALLGVVAGSDAVDAGSRFPFARFWSGHPTYNDLQGWTWNPDGDTPDGQALCDGAEHTLARIDSAGAPPNLRFVNVQFALALDGQSSAWITTKLVTGNRVVDQATIFHPVGGFAPAEAGAQNPFHVLPAPVPVTPGDIVKLIVACVPVDAGPASAHCATHPLPCTSAWVAYGVTYDGIGNAPEQASAVSPVFSSDCRGAGPLLDQTFTWTAAGGRANQAAAAAFLTRRQQPAVFTTAPDGQVVSLWTIEDFAGAGGLFVHRAVYDPDWQVIPSGTFTTRVQIECFDPAATTMDISAFTFP
jgi:hypothetical protein